MATGVLEILGMQTALPSTMIKIYLTYIRIKICLGIFPLSNQKNVEISPISLAGFIWSLYETVNKVHPNIVLKYYRHKSTQKSAKYNRLATVLVLSKDC